MNPLAPVAQIQAEVARYYGQPVQTMTSTCRDRDCAWPRQVAMYLAKELTKQNMAQIGRRFKRDRTTVLHALRVIPCRADSNPKLAADLEALRERLGGER